MKKDEIIIFTDGASRGNPGPGGWGAVIAFSGERGADGVHANSAEMRVTEIGGSEKKITNNRMELTGAIEAFKFLSSYPLAAKRFTLFSDSSYLLNGITKWAKAWEANGWKTKTKEDVQNRDLWEKLLDAIDGKNIEWKYLGGHVGIAGNERADEIATSFADGRPTKLYNGVLSGYGRDILNFDLDKSLAKEKSASRAHSNAKAYSYLSLIDGVLIKHSTWADCEKRVKGKKAKFRKALSAEDEQAIMKEWGVK
ncbi:MAG: ribonuclease HI [Candidatus Pacebacteria bacterium]|nr:ribonuclease HI [Candidatus Paceibacterota bacterium]MDD5357288.1 ribonuclease HI [Candidatus Paceibacterota bacterium]